MNKNQKGFAPILILIILVLVAGGVFLIYTKYFSVENSSYINTEVSNEKTPSSVSENKIPVYPGSTLAGTEKAPSCEKAPARSECGQTASVWNVDDDRDKVIAWFVNDSSSSGWKFESFNGTPGDPSNNPEYGYLKMEDTLLYMEIYENSDSTSTVKIYQE